jgi:type I restriction enzyme S subunit
MTGESKLPDGWRSWKFGEIAESITERVDDPSTSGLDHYVGLEHLDPDTIKISRWGSPSDVEATKLRFYPGDVIYARRRAYQRKLGVAEWDGIASAHALVLRARPEVCFHQFLPYFLQSDQFHQRALDISVGSLSPTINWKVLREEEFALPPVDAQREIVSALSCARRSLERGQDLVRAAIDLKNALIEDATWDSDQADWRAAPIRVGTLLTEPPRNGVSPRTGASVDGQIRSVSISAVQDGRFVADATTEKWCDPVENGDGFRVRAGDVFAVRGNGNRSLVGRVGLTLTDPEPACIYPDLLIRLRFDTSRIDPVLAVAIWNSPRVHARLLDRAKSSNGIYKVNGKDIASHLLPVPPPSELERLTERLHAVETMIAQTSAHCRHVALLLSTLREQLLRGAGS